ncbi:hypothetical protein GCK72_024757 [Caenorhabditis remanei]|uniref:Uncharacterized protein n=1 Tax=Caenorhabditis remanei TaxID=31234 RepID=A0A6A5G046_CAERE|nr:hypothetical protein GCK72_024757 [Caenorhabditis remanei]KAF1748290.1 hypothetical protein GCK72_024757 [Caenorhabditis remanei]
MNSSSRVTTFSSINSLIAVPIASSLKYNAAVSMRRYPALTAALTAAITSSGLDCQVPSPTAGILTPLERVIKGEEAVIVRKSLKIRNIH